jgi:hypothetical protein
MLQLEVVSGAAYTIGSRMCLAVAALVLDCKQVDLRGEGDSWREPPARPNRRDESRANITRIVRERERFDFALRDR